MIVVHKAISAHMVPDPVEASAPEAKDLKVDISSGRRRRGGDSFIYRPSSIGSSSPREICNRHGMPRESSDALLRVRAKHLDATAAGHSNEPTVSGKPRDPRSFDEDFSGKSETTEARRSCPQSTT